MKREISRVKNITTGGIILLSTLLCACCIPNLSYASEDAIDTSLEQISVINSDVEQYIRHTRRKINNNWYPPTSSFENEATMVVTIDKDGKLLKCCLTEPSPSEGFNNSLIEAASKTTYSPLPKGIKGDSLDLSMKFSMQRRHVSK